jgi:hypothetical protein
MSRIVGLLLILILTVLLVRPIRERARPYIQPALDPVYEWSARNRVHTLLNLMREEETLGHALPTPDRFAQFIEFRDFQKDASKDPWGNPYYLRLQRRGYFVGSAGRDQVPNTPDDIVSETVSRRSERPGSRRR